MTLELRPARDSDIRRLQEIQFLADPEDPRLFAFSPMAQGYAHAEAPTRQSSQEGRRDIAWTVVDPECHNEITSFGIWTVWRTEDEKRYTPRLGVHWPDEERTTVLAMALWAFMQLNRGFWIGAKAHILLVLLATDPAHRRKGATSMILQECCRHADALALPVFVEATDGALAVCKKFGFRVLRRYAIDYDVWEGMGLGLKGRHNYSIMHRVSKNVDKELMKRT